MITAILFFLTLLFYAVFSYALVDPNLVLTSNPVFWNFQQWMWNNILADSKLMFYGYLFFVLVIFYLYFQVLRHLKKVRHKPNTIKFEYIIWFLLIISPLLFSHNALSHDVFNYIFNAKMVVEYGADPHVKTALDFQSDLWLRFMHNTHTTAPYGKGWTYISIFPYLMSFGKFTLSLVSFRVWSLLSILLLYISSQLFSMTIRKKYLSVFEQALIFLNPILLIEVVSNYHNDLWMMGIVILAMNYLVKPITGEITDSKKKFGSVILSIGLLLISISIKLSTIALIPIWVLIIFLHIFSCRFSSKITDEFKSKIPKKIFEKVFNKLLSKVFMYLPDLSALLMLAPLFTVRSQQFLPWYILWVLVWTPFMNKQKLRGLIIVFTFSSALRYLPWLYNNLEYSDAILNQQKLITWSLPVIYLFTNLRRKLDFEKN